MQLAPPPALVPNRVRAVCSARRVLSSVKGHKSEHDMRGFGGVTTMCPSRAATTVTDSFVLMSSRVAPSTARHAAVVACLEGLRARSRRILGSKLPSGPG